MNTFIIFALLIVLMLSGMPISIALGLTVLTFLFTLTDVPVQAVALKLFTGIEKFEIMAIPFFILAGNLMNIAGVTGRIYKFAVDLVGWMRGGLAQVNIIGSVIFSGMSGTAIADAAGIGTIEIKAMKEHGYPVEVAVGVTAASATLAGRVSSRVIRRDGVRPEAVTFW